MNDVRVDIKCATLVGCLDDGHSAIRSKDTDPKVEVVIVTAVAVVNHVALTLITLGADGPFSKDTLWLVPGLSREITDLTMLTGLGTGTFLSAATGEFGTKVDLDFTLTRSDDGEGKLKFVVTHRNDGSEVGLIVREAEFASIPELDNDLGQLKNLINGFVMGAYSQDMGSAVIASSVADFARSVKVASYSLTYKGFDNLKDDFNEYTTATKNQDFGGYCKEVGLSTYQNDFGAKAKEHSDSECAIAQKLATDGKLEESYKFKEDKSLFAGLFVSKSYTVETD